MEEATVEGQNESTETNEASTQCLVKDLRRGISALIRDAELLNQERMGSRNFSLVITKLEEAKMWCDKVLGNLGHPLSEEFQDN